MKMCVESSTQLLIGALEHEALQVLGALHWSIVHVTESGQSEFRMHGFVTIPEQQKPDETGWVPQRQGSLTGPLGQESSTTLLHCALHVPALTQISVVRELESLQPASLKHAIGEPQLLTLAEGKVTVTETFCALELLTRPL